MRYHGHFVTSQRADSVFPNIFSQSQTILSKWRGHGSDLLGIPWKARDFVLVLFLQNNGAFKAFLGSRLTLGKEERCPAMLANTTLEDADNIGWKLLCLCYERQAKSVKTLPSKYSHILIWNPTRCTCWLHLRDAVNIHDWKNQTAFHVCTYARASAHVQRATPTPGLIPGVTCVNFGLMSCWRWGRVGVRRTRWLTAAGSFSPGSLESYFLRLAPCLPPFITPHFLPAFPPASSYSFSSSLVSHRLLALPKFVLPPPPIQPSAHPIHILPSGGVWIFLPPATCKSVTILYY